VERRAWEYLSRSAARLIPSFSQWTLREFWAGLRPRGPDDAPVLGETAISGLYVAGGQFRNGILFAPAVADLMAAVLREEDAGEFASEFSPLRYTGRAVTR
jgi:glycine oxidase